MKIRHIKKLRSFRYLPDDKEEPKLGTVLEVKNELLAAHLIRKGWGEEVRASAAKPKKDDEE